MALIAGSASSAPGDGAEETGGGGADGRSGGAEAPRGAAGACGGGEGEGEGEGSAVWKEAVPVGWRRGSDGGVEGVAMGGGGGAYQSAEEPENARGEKLVAPAAAAAEAAAGRADMAAAAVAARWWWWWWGRCRCRWASQAGKADSAGAGGGMQTARVLWTGAPLATCRQRGLPPPGQAGPLPGAALWPWESL